MNIPIKREPIATREIFRLDNMKVAILQCDDVLEKFQPQFGHYNEMIQHMFDGIDESFDAAILLGHHASTSNMAALSATIWSSE